jgi:HD-GYP domain-containing protein (c-di-GMP phosphodiesterase class II)
MIVACALPLGLQAYLAITTGSPGLQTLGVGGALLLAVGLAAVFTRSITRPLRELTRGALEIAGGKLGAVVRVKASNELGKLAEVFNYMSQQLLAYDSETRGLYRNLETGYLETMLVLANAIDSKDSLTHGHSQRVGELAAAIGREMGLPEVEQRYLLYGGLLHDLGKIGIVDPILQKRSALTDQEMGEVKAHPVIGTSIIGGVGFLRPVLPAVRSHHERWDGAGYPDGLRGEEIPLLARIVAAADIWDACTSSRPYQEPMPREKALETIRKISGQQLDPKVADVLERVVSR